MRDIKIHPNLIQFQQKTDKHSSNSTKWKNKNSFLPSSANPFSQDIVLASNQTVAFWACTNLVFSFGFWTHAVFVFLGPGFFFFALKIKQGQQSLSLSPWVKKTHPIFSFHRDSLFSRVLTFVLLILRDTCFPPSWSSRRPLLKKPSSLLASNDRIMQTLDLQLVFPFILPLCLNFGLFGV